MFIAGPVLGISELFFAVIRERLRTVWGTEVKGCRESQKLQKAVISKDIIRCPMGVAWTCLNLKQAFLSNVNLLPSLMVLSPALSS